MILREAESLISQGDFDVVTEVAPVAGICVKTKWEKTHWEVTQTFLNEQEMSQENAVAYRWRSMSTVKLWRAKTQYKNGIVQLTF